MSVERQDVRNAMAQLGSAVNPITTDGAAGRSGMTASAVCSVTDDPPIGIGLLPSPLLSNWRRRGSARCCVIVAYATNCFFIALQFEF